MHTTHDPASGSRISSVGAALADPSRATMLAALQSGRAHTAGELARWAGVAASTASKHLSQLVDTGLVTVEASGRFRYYRIASEDVADLLELVDTIDLPETNAPRRPRPGTALSYARSCYDHVAGTLGVGLYASMTDQAMLRAADSGVELTDVGADRLTSMGLDLTEQRRSRRPLTRQCLDWTERRHHLGGALGAALMAHMLEQRWLARGHDKRVLSVTRRGRVAIEEFFPAALPD